MIYLDNAATTPVRREVIEAMWPFFTGGFGNPSSRHELGQQAATALADARRRCAAVLGCRAAEIIFTSGGTEADNLAIKGIALASPRGRHLILSAVEHEAIMESAGYLQRHHGFAITHLPSDRFGRVLPETLAAALRPGTTLVTVMLANNEVGTVQPVAELAAIARAGGVPFHTDAVQAAGQLPLDLAALGADALALSGHKIGTPRGTGLLALRSRIPVEPVIHGGGQERGRRSGTEDVASAVGLAVALELAESSRLGRAARLSVMRDDLIRGVLATVPNALLTGHPTERLPASASFCFPGTVGEAVLLQLEERGILCSSGSACAAGSDRPSPVLLAMGFDPAVAQTAVRLTLGDMTREADVPTVVGAIREAVAAVGTSAR